MLIVAGARIFRWWLPTTLEVGPGLYWAMAAWLVAASLSRVPALLLNAMWMIRIQIVMSIVYGVMAFALKFAFVRVFGESGILWGTAIANMVVVTPVYFWWLMVRVPLLRTKSG